MKRSSVPILVLSVASAFGEPPTFPAVSFEPVVSRLHRPTAITHAGDGGGRIFITEQEGTVRIVRDGALLPVPFLDIADRITLIDPGCCDERGLLGIAFPKAPASLRHFYLLYTDAVNDIVVSRFSITNDPDLADRDSETVIAKFSHFYENHFGGQLAFSPVDGQLYIGLGDGAGGGDPLESGQDRASPLAKIHRVDAENGSAQLEMVAMGLRNPWRFSFDRLTGDLYIGDVGDVDYEEIDFVPAGVLGSNFGWSIMEGRHCLRAPDCPTEGLTLPVFEYGHEKGCSVTGGYVYRGKRYPSLSGIYLFADFCQGRVWGLLREEESWTAAEVSEPAERFISAFGEDESGEIYAVDYMAGELFRVVIAAE
jgi:glucose/arabinose dehydrogenase